MANTRTYVKHVEVFHDKWKDIDSILGNLIIAETNTGASFKAITSAVDDGNALFTVVFERISS